MLFCHDLMAVALDRLRHLCEQLEPERFSVELIAAIFGDAWTIVDQVNTVRQIFRGAGDEVGPVTRAFLRDAEGARQMRNVMDHIVQNIPNRSKAKGAAESLFGALMFARCPADRLRLVAVGEMIEGEVIIVARGTVPGREGEASAQFRTHDVNKPISNLSLQAFGQSLDLDLACERLGDILRGRSEDLERDIRQQAMTIAEDLKVSIDKVLAPTPTVIVQGARLNFPYGSEDELGDRSGLRT